MMQSNYQYNPLYADGIEQVINAATEQYARLSFFRFDLHFPLGGEGRSDDCAISRFFDSLKYHADAQISAKRNAGYVGKNLTSIRYVWCREYGKQNGNRHYHVVLMVNKDMYHTLGDYRPHGGNNFGSLANLIQKAWCGALKLPWLTYCGLVHFPESPCIWIERNHPEYGAQYATARQRAMYLAKDYSKHYGSGRSFGSSQLNPSVIGGRKA